jgi:chromosomal replication initiation ATPase DnaA
MVSHQPSPQRVASAISRAWVETGVSPEAIRSQSKRRDVTRARWVAWRLLHERDGFGFASIGRAFGCHHTSVLYARDNRWGASPLDPHAQQIGGRPADYQPV